MKYLRVRNWKDFQHYKDRRPPWIKFHVSLLDDFELTKLPVPAQLLYDRMLLLAAKTENLIPYELGWISRTSALTKRLVQTNVSQLIASGFLEECERGASGALADRLSQTETEERRGQKQSETETSAKSIEPFQRLAERVRGSDGNSARTWYSAAEGLGSEQAAAMAYESLQSAKAKGRVLNEAAYITGTIEKIAAELAA